MSGLIDRRDDVVMAKFREPARTVNAQRDEAAIGVDRVRGCASGDRRFCRFRRSGSRGRRRFCATWPTASHHARANESENRSKAMADHGGTTRLR
jgi:hypothetical protein